jgi:hypothetical protein
MKARASVEDIVQLLFPGFISGEYVLNRIEHAKHVAIGLKQNQWASFVQLPLGRPSANAYERHSLKTGRQAREHARPGDINAALAQGLVWLEELNALYSQAFGFWAKFLHIHCFAQVFKNDVSIDFHSLTISC